MDDTKVDTLLQIVALLLDRMGGEFALNRQELTEYAEAQIVGRYISDDYILLRTVFQDEESIPSSDPVAPHNLF